MKVSVNFLKDYLNLDNYTSEDLFKAFSYHIVEIEEAKALVEANNLTIGYVKECEEVEGTHLHKCLIEIKPGQYSQIVCGAPNMTQGVKAIVALPGAVLPGNFEIKPSKVHGIESNGMCCSLQELGIDEKFVPERFKDGIYLFNDDAPVGENPLHYLGLDDFVFDLDLTANRSDLLSVEGVAYDLGAVLNQHVEPKQFKLKETRTENPMDVTVKTKKCTKYLTRVIKNVKITESPLFIRQRLISMGVRPINNVVDITNYVMMELGQPLHAFDYDKLGNKIVVRQARDGEKLVTLDDVERDLTKDDIVITAGKEALCLAGVMGGATTEISNKTKNVVLESAFFEPLSIRKTSKRLGLKSEASTRFERTVDYDRVERALNYAAYLLTEYASGKVLKGVSGVENESKSKIVRISTSKINNVLGTSYTTEEIKNAFERYQYEFVQKGSNFTITLPSRRMDLLENYQDIIEDVARLYGYDAIPTKLADTNSQGKLSDKQRYVRNLRHTMAGLGVNEAINYSLTDVETLNDFVLDTLTNVEVMMPMLDSMKVMRHSLVNALLRNVKYNKAHKQNNVSLFEIGKRYSENEETLMFAGAFEGTFESSQWQGLKTPVDFFLVKGILDTVFAKFGYKATYTPIDDKLPTLHPGRSAYISVNNKVVGFVGELHPRYAHENDLDNTYVFELNLDLLYSMHNVSFEYKSISKFQAVERDLAIVLKKDIPASEVVRVIEMVSKKYLVSLNIFDCYTGENVASDEKSLAIKLVLNSQDKALESEDVEKVIHSILNRLDALLHARLR
ncbi:MAG: phenylalanine--tRNA ligase subunit beta [Acholeplasmatales bacterium]|nr:phenylalanine--tRNA ligase subunit beta [Acholeplasmatales bacterium]